MASEERKHLSYKQIDEQNEVDHSLHMMIETKKISVKYMMNKKLIVARENT